MSVTSSAPTANDSRTRVTVEATIPTWIQDLAIEVDTLDATCDAAYDRGDLDRAEDLDARLADARDRLCCACEQLDGDDVEHDGLEPEPYGADRDADLCMREMAREVWRTCRIRAGLPVDGCDRGTDSPEGTMQGLRERLRLLIPWGCTISDRDLVAAGIDAYRRVRYLRRRRP